MTPLSTVKGFLQILGSKPEYQKDKKHFNLMIDELERANTILDKGTGLGLAT